MDLSDPKQTEKKKLKIEKYSKNIRKFFPKKKFEKKNIFGGENNQTIPNPKEIGLKIFKLM